MKIIKKVVTFIVLFLLTAVVTGVCTGIWGNPLSKQKSEKNIMSYIIDTYSTMDFSMTDIVYDSNLEEYGTVVEFYDSEDTVFYIAYSAKENKIRDTYNDTVANGYNTFIRLSSEYGRIVSNAIAEYYADNTIMCYGELGKNNTSTDYSGILYPDMDFDMYNLPLKATISVFFDREDTSAEQFAYDLIELQKLMYSKEIAVDYYDIMYNSSILLEDFPSETVIEYLEDVDSLSETVDEYLNK